MLFRSILVGFLEATDCNSRQAEREYQAFRQAECAQLFYQNFYLWEKGGHSGLQMRQFERDDGMLSWKGSEHCIERRH